MTPDEFQTLLETAVENKLREVLGLDADDPLDAAFAVRLARQRSDVAAGERGISLADALGALDAD